MKAVISTTYDNNYYFFVPIVVWCWNKIGVEVIVFDTTSNLTSNDVAKMKLVVDAAGGQDLKWNGYGISSPKHKEATYAQCSRLYAAALDLPESEILITSDCDMALFKLPGMTNAVSGEYAPFVQIIGSDLVPNWQYPMCYISATVREWRRRMNIEGRTYQQCLDDLLGHIEAEHFRGNYWGKDQETAFNAFSKEEGWPVVKLNRARPGTQFADNRVDRDDINWRYYVDHNLIDAHLWRPGYTDGNFTNIMELLTMKYPNDDFQWVVDYRNKYVDLLLIQEAENKLLHLL